MSLKSKCKILTYLVMGVIGALLGLILSIIMNLVLEFEGSPQEGFGRNEWVTIFMMAGVVSVFLSPLVYIYFVEDRIARAIQLMGATFFYHNNELYVRRRGRYLSGLLYVGRANITNYKRVDPKLVYTGATVGGVSMGGFHVEEGGYREQVLQTDTYQLIYNDPRTDRSYPIEFIELSEDCLNEAKKDPRISKLVFRNFLCLTDGKGNDSVWSKLTQDGVLSQDLTKANYGAQMASLEKYQLTQADLWYVKSWLCDKV